MSLPAADLLSGHLTLAPGRPEPLQCSRPVIGAALMQRVTTGRRAVLLPELVGSIFTLCAAAHRATSRRAVAAALGQAPVAGSEGPALAAATVREHLQRLALDLPRAVPVPGLEPDAGWLRDLLPVLAPRPSEGGADAAAGLVVSLSAALERALFGMPPAQWLQRWQQDGGAWLADWAARSAHPHARWLLAVRARAEAVRLCCRPLAVVDEGEPGWRALAAALTEDPGFPERPLWHGAPAETGPWTRQARPEREADSAWQRLGARLADLAALASAPNGSMPLAHGALAIAPGEALAWTEMSRGLLVHWLRLEDPHAPEDTARAAEYRVVAPTEWNFHPRGRLAQALRSGALDGAHARVAAAALDPCVGFSVQESA